MKSTAVEDLVRAIGVEVGTGIAKRIGVQVGAKLGEHTRVEVASSIVDDIGLERVIVVVVRPGVRRPRLSSRVFRERGLARGAPIVQQGRLEIPQVPLGLPKLGVQVGRFGPESPELAARHAA